MACTLLAGARFRSNEAFLLFGRFISRHWAVLSESYKTEVKLVAMTKQAENASEVWFSFLRNQLPLTVAYNHRRASAT